MEMCPLSIDAAEVIAWALLDEHVKATSNTVHRVGDTVLNPVPKLAICRYKGEDGYYLFYCDNNWQVLTDTWHQCLNDAKAQAEFEYQGISSRWHMPP